MIVLLYGTHQDSTFLSQHEHTVWRNRLNLKLLSIYPSIEIITISRKDWSKSFTFSDDSSTGAITALALSANGIYLASSSKAGLFIWSTQNRRLLFRFQASLNAPITQLAFSPTQNLLAWTDVEGHFTRWLDPIPGSAPDPVKMVPGAVGIGAAVPVRVERRKTPTLFDDVADTRKVEPAGHEDGDEDIGMVDLDEEGWMEDDIGGGIMEDDGEGKRWGAEDGVREMGKSMLLKGRKNPC